MTSAPSLFGAQNKYGARLVEAVPTNWLGPEVFLCRRWLVLNEYGLFLLCLLTVAKPRQLTPRRMAVVSG